MPPQNAAAQTLFAGPSPSPSDEKSKRAAADHLLETVICDLHWTALQAGSIAMVVEACSKTDAGWTLKAWRRGLGDDCEVMRLALRLQDDMGLNKAIAAQIAGLYDSVSDAKASIVDLAKIAVPERRALAQAAERWRSLCRRAVEVLKAANGEVSRRLPALYAEDSRALAAFLEEAARGDTRRVSAFGELCPPALRQRRRTPRILSHVSCRLILPRGQAWAEIEDASRNALGLMCSLPAREGDAAVIETAVALCGCVRRVRLRMAHSRFARGVAGSKPNSKHRQRRVPCGRIKLLSATPRSHAGRRCPRGHVAGRRTLGVAASLQREAATARHG